MNKSQTSRRRLLTAAILFYFTQGVYSLIPFAHDTQLGYLNESLEWAIPAQFERATVFQNGVALVSKKGQDFFIDQKGTRLWALPEGFDFSYKYSDHYYVLHKEDGTYYYFSEAGHELWGGFFWASPVTSGKALVRRSERYTAATRMESLDLKSGSLAPMSFETVSPTRKQGVFFSYSDSNPKNVRGLVNTAGEVLFRTKVDEDTFIAGELGFWVYKGGETLPERSIFFDWQGTQLFSVNGMATNSSSTIFPFLDWKGSVRMTRLADVSKKKVLPVNVPAFLTESGGSFFFFVRPGKGETMALAVHSLDGALVAQNVVNFFDFGESLLYWDENTMTVATASGHSKTADLSSVWSVLADLGPNYGDEEYNYYPVEALR